MKSQRQRHIAAIHAAAAKLGMDTADKSEGSEYRTMLQAVGGATSTTAMADDALARVVKHLMRTLNPNGQQQRPKDGWQAAKIRQLWSELAALGVLKDPSEQGLAHFVESQVRVTALRFLDTRQANRITETLKAWLARARAKAA